MNRLDITRSSTLMIPLLLILVIAIAEMATAIYTPSLPLVTAYFNISESLAQWTVSINLLGLALSGPFYGPCSDTFGRRATLRLGMGIFLMGTVMCLLTDSILLLLMARFVQGLGGGVAVVVSFAVVNDLYDAKGSAIVLSYMGMAIALSPGLAPIAGSYIAFAFGWKMCFVVVSLAAAFLLVLLYALMPETLSEQNRLPFSTKELIKGYAHAFKNTSFLKIAFIPGMMIGGLWAWMTASPVLFISYLDVPLQYYGYYGCFGASAYIIGTLVNSRLINRYDLRSLLSVGLWLSLLSSCALLAAGYLRIDNAMIYQGLAYPFVFGLAFIIPNGTALAFSHVTQGSGTCSALLGSLEMALGALSVFLIGEIFDGTIIPIAILMILSSVISFGLLRHKQN